MLGQITVAARYAVTSITSVVGTLVALHFLSNGDATNISNGLTQIGTGIASIIAGITTLTPIAMAVWGMLRSTQTAKIADVQSLPNVNVVPSGPGGKELIAAATSTTGKQK